MSIYRLHELLAPESVALIGGSDRASSVGRAVLSNLLSNNFAGTVELVNPKYSSLAGVRAVRTVADLATSPDLAIITSPASTVPETITELGIKGCRSAVVISAGLGRGEGSYFERTKAAARQFGIRVVGPNCIGILTPAAGLNASFAAHMPKAGDLALISQSGAIVSGVIEWAASRNIGFSSIVSVGDQMDVDFGDLLDYFANDNRTRAILMYVESIVDARKFMSAARIAARSKPVVVLKAGRNEQSAKAAQTHTGAMAGSDAVYDAAFRRAGLLRVFDLEALFDAAELLSVVRPFQGDRLAILTNGGGLGVLAVDQLTDLGGKVASLSGNTLRELNRALPSNWSKANPVDIIGDAGPERYAFALQQLLADTGNDAILVMNVATALASPIEIAKCIAGTIKQNRAQIWPSKPILAVWVSDDPEIRRIFSDVGVPLYSTENAAVQAFVQLVRYSSAQDLLRATPPKIVGDFAPDRASAERAIRLSLDANEKWMTPINIQTLLRAYEIPVVSSELAETVESVAAAAEKILKVSSAIAVKIMSPEITHKSDVGGVVLGVRSADDAVRIAGEMAGRASKLRPDAKIDGFLLQQMISLPNARELIAGAADDPSFGRVLVFGQGGVSVEVVADKAIGLPPLDMNLALDLINQTKVAKILDAYRNVPAVDKSQLAILLVKLSQMVSDFPEIVEMDLNPVLANNESVVALDCRVAVKTPILSKIHPATAIRPYPNEWERTLEYGENETVFVRPVRPEDEAVFPEFFERVTAQDLRLRFFNVVRNPNHAFLARLTQIDYARAMAFVALGENGELLGVVRLHSDANYETGEYAILLRSDLKGKGLGWKLMQLIIEYAQSEGLKSVHGQVLSENTTMLEMCSKLGFEISNNADEPDIRTVRLSLNADEPDIRTVRLSLPLVQIKH